MESNHYHQHGSKKSVTMVHNKYNSPLGLYSTEKVAETLQRHTRLLGNGAVGWVRIVISIIATINFVKFEYTVLTRIICPPLFLYIGVNPFSPLVETCKYACCAIIFIKSMNDRSNSRFAASIDLIVTYNQGWEQILKGGNSRGHLSKGAIVAVPLSIGDHFILHQVFFIFC